MAAVWPPIGYPTPVAYTPSGDAGDRPIANPDYDPDVDPPEDAWLPAPEINDADVADYVALWDASIAVHKAKQGQWWPGWATTADLEGALQHQRDQAVVTVKHIYDYDAAHTYNGLWA